MEKLTQEQFIERAQQIHKDEFGNPLYDYSKVNYINSQTKIIIICENHGIFELTPNNHLRKRGCSKCAGKYSMSLQEIKDWCLKENIIFLDNFFTNKEEKHFFQCKKYHKWKTSFGKIKNKGTRCPICCKSSGLSFKEIEWLNFLKIITEYRQKSIRIDNKYFYPDAFIPETNTIYEFFGDYWHGNINNPRYKPEDKNPILKKSFGQLHQETIGRIKLFEENGYKVIYIWESEWDELKKEKNNV